MVLGKLKTYGIIVSIFLLVGCAYQVPTRTAPSATPKPDNFQEKAQKTRLKKELVEWEKDINKIIYFLQTEIAENKARLKQGVSSQERYNFTRMNELLASYRESLKRIKILQKKLKKQSSALSREIFYLELIDQYLATLKSVEAMRKKELYRGVGIDKWEKEITENYRKNNYYEVVELYNQLTTSKPEADLSFSVKAYYALSLGRLDRVAEALQILEQTLAQQFFINSKNAPLCFEVGEWLINNGRMEPAYEIFQKLSAYYEAQDIWQEKARGKSALFQMGPKNIIVKNKIDQARSLFRDKGNFWGAYQTTLEAQSECLDLNCQDEVQSFLNQLIEEANAQIEAKLWEVDEKIERADYLEAQALLFSLKRSFPDRAYPYSIQENLDLIAEREEFLKGIQIGGEDEIAKEELEKANTQLAAENYEEAIVLYEELHGTIYQIEAEEKRYLAIDGLVRLRRKKAGQLFLQAKGTENLELKKNCLVESYKLLQSAINEYPNNSYAERIKKNLDDVRAEIEKVFPDFFSEDYK